MPAGESGTTEDGLPRRVRQASLAPQLRRPSGEPPAEPEPQLRSPEQVRSIMSALQRGTTRGRIDASRYLRQGEALTRSDGPAAPGEGRRGGEHHTSAKTANEDRSNADDTGIDVSTSAGSFADAATVSFPTIVNLAVVGEDEVHGDKAHGDAAHGGPSSGGDDVTRTEEDA